MFFLLPVCPGMTLAKEKPPTGESPQSFFGNVWITFDSKKRVNALHSSSDRSVDSVAPVLPCSGHHHCHQSRTQGKHLPLH